jgi:hypothetical protein
LIFIVFVFIVATVAYIYTVRAIFAEPHPGTSDILWFVLGSLSTVFVWFYTITYIFAAQNR